MLFNSFEFLFVFLPLVLGIYYVLPHRGQNAFLVLASCAFYAFWDWKFLAPLLFTSTLDYWVSRQLERAHTTGAPAQHKRRLLLLSVASNLALLGFFKYANFFASSMATLLNVAGLHVDMATLNIVLPLAISFYTFQALSYTIDVYRGELHATNSFWDFFLSVLYFPHLIAGPIQRASWLLPQITRPRHIHHAMVREGLHLMAWGFCKKVFMADNLAPIVNQVFDAPSPTGGAVLVGLLAFTIQIYCDFSGYTDIARGLAKIMGFDFSLNFNLPYIATSPPDFWRRWHISLSSWLRDYLYISLGGNRDGKWLTLRNLMLTMLLGGLWHGAAWNFVLWGAYHGLILSLHRLSSPGLARLRQALGATPWLWPTIAWLCMCAMTIYGWLLFRATSLEQVIHMSGALLSPTQGLDPGLLSRVGWISAPLALVQLIQWRTGRLYFLDPAHVPNWLCAIAYSIMAYLTLFQGGQAQSFVYFQF